MGKKRQQGDLEERGREEHVTSVGRTFEELGIDAHGLLIIPRRLLFVGQALEAPALGQLLFDRGAGGRGGGGVSGGEGVIAAAAWG